MQRIEPLVAEKRYAEVLSQSKIWLASTGPNGDIGPRYCDFLDKGTLYKRFVLGIDEQGGTNPASIVQKAIADQKGAASVTETPFPAV